MSVERLFLIKFYHGQEARPLLMISWPSLPSLGDEARIAGRVYVVTRVIRDEDGNGAEVRLRAGCK